jgi:hypothetical protein
VTAWVVPRVWPVWTILVLAGAALQALSFIPSLGRRPRAAMIAAGGVLTLVAAARDHDHSTLVCQLAVWVWLWRGLMRSRT